MPLYAGEGSAFPSIQDQTAKCFRSDGSGLAVHALLGHQQNAGCHHKDRTEDIEDGGADAAGRGQLRAGLVDHMDATVSPGVISHGSVQVRALDLDLNAPRQDIVASGSLGLFQIVSSGIQALDGNAARLDRSWLETLSILLCTSGHTIGAIRFLHQSNLIAASLGIIQLELSAGQQSIVRLGLDQVKLISISLGLIPLSLALALISVVQLSLVEIGIGRDNSLVIQDGSVGNNDISVASDLIQISLGEGDLKSTLVAVVKLNRIIRRRSQRGIAPSQ